ncbi:MAG: SIS domain-containing protein [Spirochaetaceae bacterium]|jgi:6-phospho-3-hexuloisomerase|nr:SIS domain-containing protein [Spirochaetaceae bacterium]
MDAVEFALAEIEAIKGIIAKIDPAQLEKFAGEITGAKHIFIGGTGRSLLFMKGFAMRLMQTNHKTCLVGDACTPSVRPGDLLIVASGRGTTAVTLELVRKAKLQGARTAVITMNPDAPIPKECHCVVAVSKFSPPAKSDRPEMVFIKENLSGNLVEAAIVLITDGVVANIMKQNGITGETVAYNHANLE